MEHLRCVENGTVVQYTWDLKATCGRARQGVESTPMLLVKVLGNPVTAEAVEVEVTGAGKQPLVLSVLDSQGRSISETVIKLATATERHRLNLARGGNYVLRVSTPLQSETIHIVNQ